MLGIAPLSTLPLSTQKAAAAAKPLFMVPTPMTGLGIGGPFFVNPIG